MVEAKVMSQLASRPPSFDDYKDLMDDSLNRIIKTVNKSKNKDLVTLCQQALEQVASDQNEEKLSANKYFYIFKMAIETKLPRLVEQLLYRIQKLFSLDFLDGNCPDNCKYEEGQNPPATNGKRPRLLIDAIVETICHCSEDRDNQVQLEVIKTLLSITIAVNSKVHERTLMEAFKTQYSIHLATNSQVNRNTAKAALTQMVNAVFAKMDTYLKYGGQESIDMVKLYGSDAGPRPSGQNTSRSEVGVRVSRPSSQRNTAPVSTDAKEESDAVNNSGGGNSRRVSVASTKSNNSLEVAFHQRDEYVYSVVQNLVDNVCLHEARVDALKREHRHQIQASSEEIKAPEEAERELEERISSLKLNPVQQSPDEPAPDVEVMNEVNLPAGRFGWCVVCRNTANLVDAETQHPVCSNECQKKHIVECASLDSLQDPSVPNFKMSEEAETALQDAILVFRSIVKLSVEGEKKPETDKQISYYVIRAQIIGLELILAILEKPKPSFLHKKEFIWIIKNHLCDGLLRYSVSNEREIFSLVVSIFFCLFSHFRKYLKNVIKVFLETIFLQLLDSSNTSYHHKHLILGVFDKISQHSMMLLEIFVNYDCDVGQQDISKQIVEQLSKIANGKLARNEHKSMISAQEEQVLRAYSMQILVQMLRSFNGTIDAEIAASKVSQRLRHQSQQQLNHSQSQQLTQGSDQDTQGDQLDSMSMSTDKQSTNSMMTSNKFEVLQNQRVIKNEFHKAAQKFNFKWKNGIKYLRENNLIPDPEEDWKGHVKGIVTFLKTTNNLDKTTIGEFLGVDAELNKACLTEFIFQYDLRNKPFVESLRTVLLGFRLPGEGQIVDRMMECFGEKFVHDNPKGSDQIQGEMSAECVFLLSYATMMMQTSLHNPNAAKSRMTVEDFAKMVKGINSQKNLEPEFIQKIYETVEREPFTLNEDEDARIKQETASATSYQRKQELFQKMGAGLIQRGKNLISQKSNEYFLSVDDSKAIKPLFENIWPANLSTFSVLLEKTNDQNTAALCIEGFAHSIKICGYFNMKDERDAFVASLSKFASVGSDSRIKNKNILVIRQILELATYQGNYLGESWFFVLDCVSRLEEMINVGHGNILDSDFFETNSSQQRSKMSQANRAMFEQNRQANCEMIVQNIEMSQIEMIFQSSLNLDQDAIIQFIENLCKVSHAELNDNVNPRKFSLQKLVEIADLNMARIRFVWTRIWQMLSEHFVHVGSHENLNVSIFAIDSLRQLADKFLIKEEFASFNFQKDFLKPFEQIMLHNLATRTEIKEFIVMCITSICRSKTAYIKSGWSVIINIFTLAAQDSEEQLVQQSFQALKIAITEQFNLLESSFVELVNCLNKYSMNAQFPQQSSEAQRLLLTCAEKLRGNDNMINFFVQKQGAYFYQRDIENMSHYPPQYGLRAKTNPSAEDNKEAVENPSDAQLLLSVQKGLWFPVLTNLTNLTLDKQNENQVDSLDIFFQVLQQGVDIFTLQIWREILSQVLFPMMEDIDLAIQTPSRKNDDKERQFYISTISAVVQGFNDFLLANLEKLSFILPVYIDVLVLFISQTSSRRIIQMLIICFQQFMQKMGEFVSAEMWTDIVETFCLCFDLSNPGSQLVEQVDSFIALHETKSSDASEGHKESFRKRITENEAALDSILSKCLVQLFVVNTLKEALDTSYDKLSVQDSERMLATLQRSYDQSNTVTSTFNNCVKMQRVDQMAGLQLFRGSVQQEYRSLAAVLTLKFYSYFSPKDGQPSDNSNSLFSLCSSVLQDYVDKESRLLDLKTEKLQLAQGGSQGRGSSASAQQKNAAADGEPAMEESKVGQKVVRQPVGDISAIEMNEGILVQQVQSLTPIIQKQILNNFQQLSDQHLQTHGASLGPILIDLTLCNDFEIRAQNKMLLSKLFSLLTRSEGN